MEANKDKILSSNAFPVVGIGASAGGLDAFKKLLKAIPENSGMAYVLVQHLSPSHESLLPDILQKVTNIPVLEISDDIKVEPDHIYIIPSNKMLTASDGVLELSPRLEVNKSQRNLPIDLFFTSLAEVHQSHSIGVVLSGTASDGTLGLKAIKDHGGITFAQDEASAEYEDMPNNAVQAGVVDFILPPEKIPEKILEVTKSFNRAGADEQTIPKDDDVFKQILSLLRIRKGTDFTYYKQTTVRRRILRRMALNKNEGPSDYLSYLRENKTEQDTLYQDLLIPVTAFFRDPKSFENLSGTVIPLIIKNKIPIAIGTEPIRVWVAGCSTGEEAYSIAICFKEFLGDEQEKVQIFATDISEPAIAKARTGIYTKNEVEGLTPQRLQQFFTKTNGSYQVNKQVRDMCVFAVHNFLKDPPFGKMDFISCRNVLIYMEPYLQKKALTTFHYALNPRLNDSVGQAKGFLLLGKSETISIVPDLFTSIAKSDKLFSRKDVPGRAMQVASERTEQSFQYQNANPKSENLRTDFQKTADDIILNKYTPAGVIVNEAMDIVHLRGNNSAWLELSPGKPSLNLLKMAKSGLAFELRNILHKVKKEKKAVIKENIPLKINGNQALATFEAMPLPNTVDPYYLILFHDTTTTGNKPSAKGNKKSPQGKLKNNYQDLRIAELEQELATIREDLRAITEDQEAVNEELKSANEELQSGSEELQSVNEELETGKEELQSTNEELTVVNQQMVGLNEQVTEERNYSQAIVTTLREPLLVLDKNLRIRSANDSFYKTFQVNEKETEGRLIYDLGNKQWNIPELQTLLESVLPKRESFFDFEVNYNFASIGQRTMLLNGREIIREKSEKLILLVFEDITERREAEKERSVLSAIVDSSDDAIIGKTLGGIITSWNKGAETIFGYNPKEAIGKHISLLIPAELYQEEEMVIDNIKKGQQVLHFDTVRLAKDGRRINISLTVSPVKDKEGKITGASKIARDITDQVNARKRIKESEEQFRTLADNMENLAWIADGDGSIYWYNKRWYEYSGTTLEEMQGWGWQKTHHPDHVKRVVDFVKEAWHKNEPFELTFPLRGADGEYKWFLTRGYPIADTEGKVIRWIGTNTDIDEQRKAEELFRQTADLVPQKIWTADAEGNKNYFNQKWLDYTGLPFEELRDWGWKKIIHPDDWEETRNQWQLSIDTGKDYEVENRLLGKNGEYLWHLTRASALKGDDGKIKMWVGSKTEIQEQKEQKEKLEKAVNHRTYELQTANESLQQKNQEIALSKYNKRFLTEFSEKFSAYKLHNEFFTSLVQFITDTTRLDYVFVGRLVQTDNNEFTIQTIALTAFGKPAGNISYPLPDGPCEQVILGKLYSYPKHCRKTFPKNKTIAQFKVEGYIGYPLFDKQENAVGLIAVMHEKAIDDPETVTSVLKIVARRAEIELDRITIEGQLEQKNALLLKKNEELVKMNKELESFAYISSHDLQEPLRKIQTFATRIMEKEYDALSDKGKTYFQRMQNSALRMQTLIQDLLSYSRTANAERKFKKTDLNKVVKEVKKDFKEVIRKTNATIEAEDLCEASIIPFQFHQMIYNLIGNSLKYSNLEKPPHIIIKSEIAKGSKFQIEALSSEKDYCHITISDNGIGFDPQYKDKIFEVFQRLYGKDEYPGTGIGLSIVKRIVENHDGHITATGELNKGATFDIYIPA